MMSLPPEFEAAVKNGPSDNSEMHARALERLASDIRNGALVGGHMRATAEVSEGVPIIKDGKAWENNRPTGRVLHQIELIIDRNALPKSEPIELPPGAKAEPVDRRHASCVEAWPDCWTGGFNPSCCRFPKSCSCDI
jgi:hypothetical protein